MSKTKIYKGDIHISPEEAGYESKKLDKLDEFLIDLVDTKRLQGASYLLARKGKIFALRSMGKLKYDDDTKDFLPDSIRWVASITKVFTSIAIMQLIEDGKLYIEQPVMTIIKEFDTPMHNRINIFHLLTHTSGIMPDSGYFLEPYPVDSFSLIRGEEWIKKILEGPLYNKTGEAWCYSTAGFGILGEIISRASGMPYEEYVVKNIIEPLGMEKTFFTIPKEYHDQVCVVQDWEKEDFLTPRPNNYQGPPSSGGGLSTTLVDLWKLGEMFLNKGTFNGRTILGRKTVEAMARNYFCNLPAYAWSRNLKSFEYGLGLSFTSDSSLASPGTFNHEGFGRSAFYVDPSEEFIVIYFVPTPTDWEAESMVNPRNIIWSGLK